MNVELVTFHPRHLEVAQLRPLEAETLKRLPEAFDRIEELAKKSIEAVTLMADGRILLCCGVMRMYAGVAELWLMPTIYVPENPVLVGKACREFVEVVAKGLSAHRLQALAVADELHDRFMEFLGFETEGTFKKFDDQKRDYRMWARFFDGQGA